MASKEELYFEAYRRGILPQDKRMLVEELAARRGVNLQPEVKTPQVQEMPSHQQGVIPEQPQTTAEGVLGAATRGVAPYAMGAAGGAMLGAPTGVGVVPGALAGAGSVALAEVIGDPVVMGVNKLLGTDYTLPTQALSDLFTRMGVPEPDTEAERVVQATASGAAGAGGFASLGNMLAKSSVPAIQRLGKMFATQPTAQVMGGAGAGAATQEAQEQGYGPGVQFAAGMAGGTLGALPASLRGAAQAPQALKEAEDVGVRVLTSDIAKPESPGTRFFQAITERIPFVGTGGQRAAQQAERKEAIRNFFQDYGVADIENMFPGMSKGSVDEVLTDFLKTREGYVRRYQGMKRGVIEDLSSKVGQHPFTTTRKAVDDAIAELRKINNPAVESAVRELEDFKKGISYNTPAMADKNRKILADSLETDDLSRITSQAAPAFSKVYAAFNNELGDLIKTYGGRTDYKKWKLANARLKQGIEEFKDTTFKKALEKGEITTSQIERMLSGKDKRSTMRLYRNLSPQGKEHAKMAILQDIAPTLIKKGEISTEDFVPALRKKAGALGVFFNKNDIKRAEGLARVLNLTQRGKAAETVQGPGIQTIMYGGPAAASYLTSNLWPLIMTASVGGAARVYESKPVRDILLRLPRTKPGSTAEAELLKRLASTIQSMDIENEQD